MQAWFGVGEVTSKRSTRAPRNTWTSRSPSDSESLTRAIRPERAAGRRIPPGRSISMRVGNQRTAGGRGQSNSLRVRSLRFSETSLIRQARRQDPLIANMPGL